MRVVHAMQSLAASPRVPSPPCVRRTLRMVQTPDFPWFAERFICALPRSAAICASRRLRQGRAGRSHNDLRGQRKVNSKEPVPA